MAANATPAAETRGLAGTVLGVAFIGILIGASYWVLLPFLPALVWATMLVISTWPLMLKVEERLKGRRALAATIMVSAFFLVFIVPLLLAISTIVDNADQIMGWVRSASSFERPPAPTWLRKVPLAGPKLADNWNVLSAGDKDDLITKASPYMGDLLTWFIAQVGNVGMLFLHFLLTLALSAVLYMNGERAASAVKSFATRLAGERGEEAAILAARAIRAVALGVVGTAMCQALVACVGFVVAGIHQATLLTALIFFFSVIQIGPLPVLLPLVGWLYYSGSPGWAAAMFLWTILIAAMDNVLRPMLIRRGANLPLLLIFAGVIGGLIAFGIIGLFVGPVVLAVSYTLLNAWIYGVKAPA